MEKLKNTFFGPLKVSRKNPRYFEDERGKAIFLTGSHTWANLQEFVAEGEEPFDYEQYLDFMEQHNHNFMRMWQRENAQWSLGKVQAFVDPLPFVRTGPDMARDGKPKFDLNSWNEAYFARMRSRVIAAGQRGIYVELMMFSGGASSSNTWKSHPYNPHNNINGIGRDNVGADVYSLANPEVLQRQKRFIVKVLDTLNDLDNVLYEIINEVENKQPAVAWHYHLVEFIQQYELSKPKQHPVGMTSVGGSRDNSTLFASTADWISPGYGQEGEYKYNPPAADGSKVIICDTDHLWGHGGTYTWVWKTFLRGMHPIFMDPWRRLPEYPGIQEINTRDYKDYPLIRTSMGQALQYAERIDLNRMIPRNDLASSQYCLANPGHEYLVYSPQGGEVNVDMTGAAGKFNVEWFEPATGKKHCFIMESEGKGHWFAVPFENDALLYIY